MCCRRSSRARTSIALNNGGDDTVNALKAIREFGLKAKVMGFGLDSPIAIKSMGLRPRKARYNVNPWVNAGDAETKAFIDKFIQRRKMFPGSFQVGNYSAAKSYLKAVEATNSTDPKTVIGKIRADAGQATCSPRTATCRPDGRMVHSVALTQIKTPERVHRRMGSDQGCRQARGR